MTNRHTITIAVEHGRMQKIYLHDVREGDTVGLCFAIDDLAGYGFGHVGDFGPFRWWICPTIRKVKEKGAVPVLVIPSRRGRISEDFNYVRVLRKSAATEEIVAMTDEEWRQRGASP